MRTISGKPGNSMIGVQKSVLRGRPVMHHKITVERKQDFSLSGLPGGICYMKIISGAGTATYRIMETR